MTLAQRAAWLEETRPRMLELEERMDYAERSVAQGRETDRLQGESELDFAERQLARAAADQIHGSAIR